MTYPQMSCSAGVINETFSSVSKSVHITLYAGLLLQNFVIVRLIATKDYREKASNGR